MGFNWGQAAQAAIPVAGGLFAQWAANKYAKKAQKEMNKYNSPKAQMERFREAGLNPNLMYEQGSAGNQTQPLPTPDYSRIPGDAIAAYNQSRMVDSQVSANNASTAQKLAQTELTKIKTAVEASNPLLNKDYLAALVSSLQSSASIKASEASTAEQKSNWFKTSNQLYDKDGKPSGWDQSNGYKKMDAELRLLEQKFDLGTSDQKIKAEVLNSKEFQNAILEVQKRFMTDADITPQHIVEFGKLLLMKLF